MSLLHPRIRPLLALMQGLLRTVRGGRLARHLDGAAFVPPAADGRHQPLLTPPSGGRFTTVPPSGATPNLERLGARWGMSPAARDGRDARPRACPSRRDLPDVGSHSEPPGRPRRTGSCRTHRTSQSPPKRS